MLSFPMRKIHLVCCGSERIMLCILLTGVPLYSLFLFGIQGFNLFIQRSQDNTWSNNNNNNKKTSRKKLVLLHPVITWASYFQSVFKDKSLKIISRFVVYVSLFLFGNTYGATCTYSLNIGWDNTGLPEFTKLLFRNAALYTKASATPLTAFSSIF